MIKWEDDNSFIHFKDLGLYKFFVFDGTQSLSLKTSEGTYLYFHDDGLITSHLWADNNSHSKNVKLVNINIIAKVRKNY